MLHKAYLAPAPSFPPMGETIVVDPNGRVYLPKIIRKLLGLRPYSLMEVDVRKDEVVLRRIDSVAEMGRGMFGRRRRIDLARAWQKAQASYVPE